MLEKRVNDMGGLIHVLKSGNNKLFDNISNSQCANNKKNSSRDKYFPHNNKYSTHHFAYINGETTAVNMFVWEKKKFILPTFFLIGCNNHIKSSLVCW